MRGGGETSRGFTGFSTMAAHNAPPSPPLSPSPSSPFPSAPFILPVMPSSPSPSFSSSPPPSPCLDSEGADMFLGLDDDVLAAEEWGEKKDSFEEDTDPHSVFTKARLAYCCGNIFQTEGLLGSYLSVFLVDVVGLRPSLVGTLLLIKQIWDAITDPIVGGMSDQTKSSWGRRKPWIFAGGPLLFIGWLMLWSIPGFAQSPGDTDLKSEDAYTFLYYLFSLLLVTTSLTFLTTPYVALFQDIAPSYHVRTKIVAVGTFLSYIGNVLIMGGMGFILFQNEDHVEDGYFMAALVFGPFFSFSRVISCCFITEAPMEKKEEMEENKKGVCEYFSLLKESYKALFFKDFAFLCANAFCGGGLNSMLTCNLLLYIKYYLGQEKYSTPILLSFAISIGLSIPFWVVVLKRMGKKNAGFLGMTPMMIIFLSFLFVQPGQGRLVLFLCTLLGCGASCFNICINSMQPDVVHAYMKQAAVRNEGVMYSLFQLSYKIGFAIGISISAFVLDLTGFVADENQTGVEQNEATKLALQIMTFPVPGILCGISILLFYFIKDYKEEFEGKGDQEKDVELLDVV